MKKLSAFFVMLMLIFAAGVCVHAADFTVSSGTRLPDGEAYEPYSANITMEGGNEGYTFEFVSGFKPVGLTVNSDGSITGTPTTSGFYSSMNIRISHTDGTSAVIAFSILTMSRSIKVEVNSPANLVYDGLPHNAQVTCYDKNGNLMEDLTPTVKYGKDLLDAATDAGTYYITVLAPSGCLISERVGDEYLVINTLGVSEISVADKSFQYDGQPHGITEEDVTVNPAAAGYAVEYKKKGASEYTSEEPVSSGTYSVRVHTTNSNYETVYATATLTIVAQGVNFRVTNTTAEYDGNEHEVNVVCDTSEAGYTVSYTDANGKPIDGKPINAGTYKVIITLTNTDAYSVGEISADTLIITPKTIKFTASPDSFTYDGTEKEPVISTEPSADSGLYTISYRKTGEETPSVIKEVGTYDVVITLTDSNNYVVDENSTQTITVTAQTVNFNVTDNTYTYNGNSHIATVTPDVTGVGYTVTYTNSNGETVANPTNADTYTIGVTLNDSNGYTIGTITPNTLVINPQAVNFNVTDNTVPYDGAAHEATVTTTSDIPQSSYTVQYRKSGVMMDSVTDAGEYEIVITISDSNYILDSSFSSIMTVTSVVSLNIGNSPAAMIYKDSVHSGDADWQAAALNELKTNRKFSSEYLPNGCSADITYNLINNIDVDGDKYTVIVKGLDAFIDPGLSVNGSTISGSAPVQVEGVEGLYKVTYTYDGESFERYVAVAGRIGDVNGDGSVNAVDANYLDDKNNVPNGVIEARVWDVNKDNVIDGNDAAAIRNRFRISLVSYYPWIEN